MARTRIPSALEMRELKYGAGTGPDSEETRLELARALRDQGRRSEAVLLFEGRPGHPFVAEEVRDARERGAGFLLLLLQRMGAPVGPDDLASCARAAEAAGRWMEARQLHLARGDRDALVRISPDLPECLRPAAEPPTPPSPPA
jgi:hypothetical protein